MHVLQWIAVEGEDKQQAMSKVTRTLEEFMGDSGNPAEWYDWFVTGGGRWNPNEEAQYDDSDDSMVIAVGTNKDKATGVIDKAIESRVREFNEYRQDLDKALIDVNAELDKYDGTTDYSFSLFSLSKCIDMLQGKWDYNSYFFDLKNYSTNPKFFLESLDKGAENWYIVPVDFHF